MGVTARARTGACAQRRGARWGIALAAATSVLVSGCWRDRAPTEVGAWPALAIQPRLPDALTNAGNAIAAQLVPFERVHITIRRITGAIALDTTALAEPGADSLAFSLDVPLAIEIPLLGEAFTIVVECLDAAGEPVYRAGPVLFTLQAGARNDPVELQLRYVGDGSDDGSQDVSIRIVPGALSLLIGETFTLSAIVEDATGTPLPDAPVIWSVLDPSLVQLDSPLAGIGIALGLPGTARVVAQVPDGPADTAEIAIALPPPIATALEIVTDLVDGVAGEALPTVTVRAVDVTGAVVSSFDGEITLSLGDGPSGSSLIGTTSRRAVNGIATFPGLTIERAATDYRLAASTTGLATATSGAFSIANAAAALLTLVGGNDQSGLIGLLLGTPLSVRVTDAFQNPVGGFTVTWDVILGTGILGARTTSTNASGVATNTWSLGLLPGLQRATASAAGLAGSPVLFTATALIAIG